MIAAITLTAFTALAAWLVARTRASTRAYYAGRRDYAADRVDWQRAETDIHYLAGAIDEATAYYARKDRP